MSFFVFICNSLTSVISSLLGIVVFVFSLFYLAITKRRNSIKRHHTRNWLGGTSSKLLEKQCMNLLFFRGR